MDKRLIGQGWRGVGERFPETPVFNFFGNVHCHLVREKWAFSRWEVSRGALCLETSVNSRAGLGLAAIPRAIGKDVSGNVVRRETAGNEVECQTRGLTLVRLVRIRAL